MRLREWSAVASCALSVGACGSSESNAGKSGTSSSEPREIGAPCLMDDESSTALSGFGLNEINLEEMGSPDCDSGMCITNHFQGRASCPYGQTEEEASTSPECFLPRTDEPVPIAVLPQFFERRAERTVTCTCRCAGPVGPFCDCPSGMICDTLLGELGSANAASYCVLPGTVYDSLRPPQEVCERSSMNCGDPRPYPPL